MGSAHDRRAFSSEKIVFDRKALLITGGTGSFGQTAARHFLARGIAEVRIFSRDEAKQDAMRHAFPDTRVTYVLGDVRDRASIDRAMEGIHWVFHAAALKQVPSCEAFPEQAVMTNVLGSQNVIEAAVSAGIQRAVFLSTDKAVHPVNAMGMTKALMERLVQARARRLAEGGPILCCVRYGNVLYSRGSVVPLFVDQALSGRPLTVTRPEMTRFLISLESAVGLVEEALTRGEAGDVFVLKSPAGTAGDLASAVLRLFGVAAPIRDIGIRPGEKIHEILATAEELSAAEDFGHGYRLRALPHRVDAALSDYTSETTERLDVAGIARLLETVPEIRARLPAPGPDGRAR
jgi:UDP-N-acetylglucosamine 4,6-dehydratase